MAGSEITGVQRRRARQLLKSGATSNWADAMSLARAERPDTSDDIERQLVRSLARQRGRRAIFA